MFWGKNRGKWKGWLLAGIKPRTPGLCSQCSATELQQPDNHQPSQSSIYTVQLVLKYLSGMPGIRWVFQDICWWQSFVRSFENAWNKIVADFWASLSCDMDWMALRNVMVLIILSLVGVVRLVKGIYMFWTLWMSTVYMSWQDEANLVKFSLCFCAITADCSGAILYSFKIW